MTKFLMAQQVKSWVQTLSAQFQPMMLNKLDSEMEETIDSAQLNV